MPQAERVSLLNLSRGAAIERFDHELSKVLANIKDVNTDAKKKRKITLEVVLTPYPDRTGVDVELSCTSKLASLAPVTGGSMFIAKQGEELAAFTHDLRQEPLFPEEKQENNVVAMPAAN
jgi:hypothetical protein